MHGARGGWGKLTRDRYMSIEAYYIFIDFYKYGKGDIQIDIRIVFKSIITPLQPFYFIF